MLTIISWIVGYLVVGILVSALLVDDTDAEELAVTTVVFWPLSLGFTALAAAYFGLMLAQKTVRSLIYREGK